MTRPPARVTPLIAKLAADFGVDLATITGSGVGGRIRAEDVLATEEAQSERLYRSLFGEDDQPTAHVKPGSPDDLYDRLFPEG